MVACASSAGVAVGVSFVLGKLQKPHHYPCHVRVSNNNCCYYSNCPFYYPITKTFIRTNNVTAVMMCNTRMIVITFDMTLHTI